MILTICLLILVLSFLKRPADRLVKKLENVDWKDLARNAWGKIVIYSKKAGRMATHPVLIFYYTMSEGELTTLEKALVYAGIIYIAVPHDLLPRKILGWLGILDDVGVAVWVVNKISNSITPIILQKVEKTLDDWFGPEIYIPATNVE